MKSVALVGGAERTREGVRDSHADAVWVTSTGYKFDFLPRLDAIFEMHPAWITGKDPRYEYAGARAHWQWLQQNEAIPVYMLEQRPEVPMSLSYPIGEVSRAIWGNNCPEFSSTLDYMIALAIYGKVERIELYGFEMGSNTEYTYQREGLACYRGYAQARGLEVVLPKDSRLKHRKLYGYEGGQMIARHDLEEYLKKFTEEHLMQVAKMQYLEGALSQARNGDKGKLAAQHQGCRDAALIASGAVQTLKYLIQEVDLEEPTIKLSNPLRREEQ